MAKVLKTTIDPTVIKIPMRSYLVKYLTKLHGSEYKVTKHTFLGLCIVDVLTKDYQKSPSKVKASYFKCIVPNQLCVIHGYFPKYSHFSLLEKKIDKIFKQTMYQYIDINIQSGYNKKREVKKCIEDFLGYYRISEDDFKYETAYRNYIRYVEQKSIKMTKKNKPIKTSL